MGVLGPDLSEEDGVCWGQVSRMEMQPEWKWVRFWGREKPTAGEKLVPSVQKQAVQCHMTDDQI